MMKRYLVLLAFIVLGSVSFSAHAADLLCPGDGDGATPALPDSMGGVQADIERYALCVQRAQLLQQLDGVAESRAELLKKVREPDQLAPITDGLGGAIPRIAGAALPPVNGIDAATKNLKPGQTKIIAAIGNPLDATTRSLETGGDKGEWKTRRIWGQGLGIRAQLSNGNGVLVNVTKGDPLPDGPTVEEISVRGVTVSRNGKSETLAWEQVVDTGSDKPGPL